MACGLLAASASAQTLLYWDINGATAGAGGATPSGVWEGLNWSTSSAGTATTGAWSSGATAVFAADSDATGSYTITLNNSETVGGLTFKNGAATLSGSALTLTGSGAVSVGAAPVKGTIASVVGGSVGLTKSASGELVLQGANTFTGDLTAQAGTLTLDNDQAASTGNIILSPISQVVLHSSKSLTTLANPIDFSGNAPEIDVVADANNTLKLNGVLSDSHPWNITGAGTVVLGGNAWNTFSGTLTVQQGTLVVAKDQALGTSLNNTIVNNGATVAFSGGFNYGSGQGTKGLTVKGTGAGGSGALNNLSGRNIFNGTVTFAADASIGATAGDLVLNGPVTGNFNLTKVGAGIVDFQGANNSFGTTLVQAGTVGIWGSSVLGSGQVTVNAGAALEGNGNVPGGVNLSGTLALGGVPDSLATGAETWNGGAAYVWNVTDATGMGGVNPGYDVVLITGSLAINASAANPITLRVNSLDPSFFEPGDPDHFLNTQQYDWTIASASAGITGFSADKFVIDASGFTAARGGGKFVLLQSGNNLVLRFDPAPVISCPSLSVQGTALHQCGAPVAFAASALDNQLGVSITYATNGVPITSPWPFPTGTTLVNATATDSVGNTATCSFTVTVNDTEAPAIVGVPTSFTVQTGPGRTTCDQVATWTEPTATDNCGVTSFGSDHHSGDTFLVGDTLVTYTARDAAGNVTSSSFTVTVQDNTKPVIAGMPTDITVQTGPGRTSCDQVATWTEPTASDNCGVTSFTSDHHSGDTFPVGSTTVTYTARDAAGNSTSSGFTVTVKDNTAPSVNFAAVAAQSANADGTCNATVPDVRPLVRAQATDNCTAAADLVITQTPSQGSTVNGAGSQPISVSVADAVGNTTTGTVPFTVYDVTAPVVTAPADITVDCSASLDPGNTGGSATATDNCSTPSVSYTDYLPTEVLPSAMAGWAVGNQATATGSFIDGPQGAPIGTGSFHLTTGTGSTNGGVLWLFNTNYNGLALASLTELRYSTYTSPGSTAGAAVAPALKFAVDYLGNGASWSTLVFEPVYSPDQGALVKGAWQSWDALNGKWWSSRDLKNGSGVTVLPAGAGSTFTWATLLADFPNARITIADAVGIQHDLVVSGIFVSVGQNGLGVPWAGYDGYVDAVIIGTNGVSTAYDFDFTPGNTCANKVLVRQWKATDASGNNGYASQLIRVQDTTPPVISTPGDITQSTDSGKPTALVSFSVSATDNCDASPVLVCQTNGVTITSPWTFPTGTTTVICTARDACGNTGSTSFTVTVNDTEKPTITAPQDVTVNTDPAACSAAKAGVALGTPVAGDNCGVAVVSNNAPDPFPKGPTVVTWTVVDTSGNMATATQNVTVEDHEKPSITGCPTTTLYVLSPNGQSQPVSWTAPTANDNCGVTSFTPDHNPGDVFPLGKSTVTYTALDAANNRQTCAFDVVVVPTTTVYVDAAYAATPNGTPVTWPNNNGTGVHYIGYDAFATIQGGIDGVVMGGTVNVAAGTYQENDTITKAVTVLGPNAGKAGNDPTRGPEAIVRTAVINPDVAVLFNLQASGIVVDGLMFDGQNAALDLDLVNGYNVGGVVSHTATALQNSPDANGDSSEFAQIDHLTVQNNVLKNFAWQAVYLYVGTNSVSSWNYIRSNRFENAWEGVETYALLSDISDNTFNNVGHGIGRHGVCAAAAAGFVPRIANNSVVMGDESTWEGSTTMMGIWVNYQRGTASPLWVTNNTISFPNPISAGHTNFGIWALTIDQGRTVTFRDNVVNGNGHCTVGFLGSGITNANVCVENGAFNNTAYGVVAGHYNPTYPEWPMATALTLSNVTVSGCSTGLYALALPTQPGVPVLLAAKGGTSVSGGSVGAACVGQDATLAFPGTAVAASFSGQSDAYIQLLSNGSTVASQSIDATAVQFEGELGAAMSLAENYAVEDKVLHKMDNAALGLVTWTAGNDYVTSTSGSIQRGIDAASPGWTVNVAAGAFTEQLEVTKDLTVAGQGPTTVLQSPAVLALSYTAQGVTLKPVVFVHDTANATVRNLQVAGNGLGAANNRFAGVGFYQAGGLASGLVIQGFRYEPLNGVQGGYGIRADAGSAAPSLTVTGCTVSDCQKNGLDFRGASLVANVTGNTVVGAGPTALIAQNGIVFVGASGTIANNDVSGFSYTPTDTEACGVLIYGGGATITGNNVTDCQVGVDLAEPLTGMGIVANNNFARDQAGLVNEAAAMVNAQNNWWGDVSGPANPANPGAVGAAATGNLSFSPWLGDGTDTQPGVVGFQPNPSPLYYAPDHLVFSTQPGGAGIGSALAPQPVVQVIDANGGLDTVFNGSVMLVLGSNPGHGVLSGTTSTTAVGGVASFSDLAITVGGGQGYTLVASSANLASATSAGFDIANPVPTLASLSPFWTRAGSGGFTLTVNGTGFVPNSVVKFNGVTVPTTFVNATTLTASIASTDIDTAGPVPVTVFNPLPTGGETSALTFRIEAASPSVVYVDGGYTGKSADALVGWPCPSGTCAGTHIIGYDAFASVQEALAGVAAGGVVNVAPGTYTEAGQLAIGKDVSVVGVDKATTIVKPAQDTASSDDDAGSSWWQVGAGHTFNLSGVTLDGSGHKVWFGIRHQGSGVVQDCVFTNLQYEASGPSYKGTALAIYSTGNVDVSNCVFAAIGRVGVAPYDAATGTYFGNTYLGKGASNWLDYAFVIQYGAHITVVSNQISGNLGVATDGSDSCGIAVWDDPGTKATLSGNTLSNNSTALAVAIQSGGTADPTVAIGDGNLFLGGETGVALQNVPVYFSGTPVTGTPVLSFGASTFQGQSGQAISIDEDILAGTAVDISSVAFQDASGNAITDNFAKEDRVYHALDATGRGLLVWNANNVYVTPTSASIQRGIDVASAGWSVNVAAGTFVEQLEVAKALTVTGQGTGTVVQSPATLAKFYTTSAPNHPVVHVHDASNVTIQNLVVDGNGQGNGNYRMMGVSYYRAGGLVQNLVVKGVRETPINGDQHGNAIYAYNDIAPVQNLEVAGCQVFDFQKNGITINGAYLAGNVHGNQVTGAGAIDFNAQNGIQFGFGSSGLIQSNVVSGFNYTPTSDEACGILVYQSGATVTANTISACELGVGVDTPSAAMGVIANNNLAGNQSGVYNYSATPLDARNNWWGDVSGPAVASNPGGSGSGITGNVTYGPWLGDGTDTQPGVIGFQPNPSPLYYAPDHLVFSTQPGGAGIGSPLAPQPVVQVIDANGGLDTVFNGSVTLALGNNPSAGTLSGVLTQPVVGGVATFAGLQIDHAGAAYTLVAASASPITGATSTGFDISNPAVTLASLNPAWAVAGDQGFTLTLTGSGFVYNSTVNWGNSSRTPSAITPTTLSLPVTAADIVSAGTVNVSVTSPAPGGGTTDPLTFTVYSVPTDVYVDATYGPASSGAHRWGYDAFSSIGAGLARVAPGGAVHVAAGTYAETLAISKPVSLLGANATVAGCASRGLESTINGGLGLAVDVQSDGVVVAGFQLQGATGLRDLGHVSVAVSNNVVQAGGVGLDIEGVSPSAAAKVVVQDNCVALASQLAGSVPTVGIAVAGVSGAQAPVITGNGVQGAFYGYLLYAVNASVPTTVQGGTIAGVMQGVAVVNADPRGSGHFAPSAFAVDSVSMSGFTGNYPASPGNNFQAGVYLFSGGGDATAALTGTVTNVTVTGVGKISPDCAGLSFADFSTGAGVRQQVVVQNSTISGNLNRGINVRGANAAVTVTRSSILNNGADPYGVNGNNGFGIIVRDNAQVSVRECFIANPAAQASSTVAALAADADTASLGATLVVSGCSVVNNGNAAGLLATQSAGTLNASGNWWGDVNPAALGALMHGAVDFTPYLDSGTDVDSSTPGFQGDLTVLHVTAAGAQTGAAGRIQEGIDLVSGGKVIIEAGAYTENVLANKDNLELAGVGQGTVTVMPALAAPNPADCLGSLCAGSSQIILVSGNNVKIHDLTLDGHNPALTSGVLSGGVDVSARNGIITDHLTGVYNNLEVYRTTVKNIYLRGIYASSQGSFNFHDNTVQNVQGSDQSIAIFNYGGSGVISGNTVSDASDAIAANWSTGTVFQNNTITGSGSGVHTDNNGGSGGVADTLTGNQVFAMAPGAYGVWVFAPYVAVQVTGNNISGCDVGLALAGQQAPVTPVFSNNTVTAGTGSDNYGAYVTTSLFGWGSSDVSGVFQGNHIQQTAYGFYLEDEDGYALSTAITGNNVISANQYGVFVTGTSAKVKIENADLSNNTVAGVQANIGALVDAGNCGADVTGLGASTGGNNLAGYFSGAAKAIVNLNTNGVAVLAYQDNFGAVPGQSILGAVTGAVQFSQSGGLLVTAPPVVSGPAAPQCLGEVATVVPPAATLAQFLSQGGMVSASALSSIASTDTAVMNAPGHYTVTRHYALTDVCGQSQTADQTIQVVDSTPPTIVSCAPAPAPIAVGTDCHAPVPDLTGGVVATDNCTNPVVITQDPLAGNPAEKGIYTITLTAKDVAGNQAQCQVSVTNIDATAPTLTVPANITVTSAQSRDPYATGQATATDNCPDPVAITYDDDRSRLTNCNATGTIVRTWTATDKAGNSASGKQYITVVDTTAPQFTFVPADLTVSNDRGNCSALVSYAQPTAKVVSFSQGFEDAGWMSGAYSNNPSVDWNDYNSHIYRVDSGTDGITSRSGAGHAVIDSTVSATQGDNTGAFCRLGGYSGVFGAGFRVAQDIYIDLNDPKVQSATTASGYAWDLSAASATPSLGYGRDFIFHAAAYDASGVVIAASNNSSDHASNRGGDLRLGGNYTTLTASGWYTFEWVFRNVNGVLAVDLSVRDTSGMALFTQTLSDPSDTIPDLVGGNRYLWFTFLNVDKLAIDNTVLERFVPVNTSLASGSAFQVGTNTVVCTATDACNNTVTTNFTVTVLDAEKPSITAPSDLANIPAALGLCVATNVALGVPDTSDNCGIATVTNDAPVNFPLTTTVVTWTVVDIHGNVNTATQRVTVVDREGPMITTVPGNRVIDADPTAHAALPDLTGDVKATDCSLPLAITQQPPAGAVVGLGDTLVTLFVTDAAGNTSQCQATITVRDVTPPAIVCPLPVTVTTLQAKDPYATGYATATDAGGAVTITYTDDISGLTNCNSTGELFRTWVATDPSQNVNSCVQTITIVDTNAPYFVSTPTAITVTNDPGQCSAIVQYPAPVARDLAYFQGFEDPNFTADATANLLTFTEGQSLDWTDLNSRLYRVPSGTDGISSRSGVAHGVIDSTGTAAGPGYAHSGAYTWLGGLTSPFGTGYRVALDVYLNLSDPAVANATATTGYGWDLDTAASDPSGLSTVRNFVFHTAAYDASGIVIGADMSRVSFPDQRRNDLLSLPNYAVITNSGWYTFEWQFRNAGGVLAVDLAVLDASGTKLFTQTLSNANDLIAGVGGNPAYMWAIFVFADKLPIDNTTFERNVPVFSSMASGSAFAVGTTTVTNVATDACGNSASSTFTVTVLDKEPPTANVPSSIMVDNDPGQCGAVVNFIIPSNWDNCGVDTVTATPPSGSTFAVGTTNVTVVVTDIHGNSATNSFSVTVNDAERPALTQPANIVQGVDAGQNYATVSFTLPAATDNCGVATVTATPPSGSQFLVGTNTVTVQATDIHGNSTNATFTVAVIALPGIVQQPASRTNFAGSTATFSVSAASPASLTYQWKKNTAPIAGATDAVLTLSNVQDSDAATYTVDISNLAGTITSTGATLTVFDPPAIVSQPLDRTNNAATTATFSVALAANSTPPFSYQWFKNGTNLLVDGGNITGATSNVLSLANVLAADQGQYSVQVSNVVATLTSSNAVLTVVDPYITAQPVSVTNRLGGSAQFAVTAVGTAPLTYQWQQNGTLVSGATGSAYSIGTIRDSDAGTYQVTISNSVGTATSVQVTLTVTHPPVIVGQPGDLILNVGQQALFSVRANGATPFSYQWRKNTVDIPGAKNSSYGITSVVPADAGAYSVLVSNVDGTALSTSASLTVIVAPAITSQPTSVTNPAGSTVSFSVLASGTAPAYYWYKNATNLLSDGGNLSGSSSNVLTLTNVLGADAGSYSVLVSNRAGMVLSSNVSLVVIDPIITSQPVGVVANLGAPASLTVGAYGTAVQYQWRKGGSPIAGASAATYALAAVSDADAGSYDVRVSNTYGAITSAVVTVTVIDPPVITLEPSSVTVNATSNATFSVVASGTSPSYQWRKNGADISGATTSSLTLVNVSQADAADYTVFLSNAAGSQLSTPAHLTVIDPPVITLEPSSVTVNATSNATFSVVASGTSPSYQWRKNGADITGATTSSLTLVNVSQADAADYTVFLSNAAGSQLSTPAHLTVIDPPVITLEPSSVTVNATSNATFSVVASGTSPSYQWRKNGADISGATTSSLTLVNVSQADAADYTVFLSNAAGSQLSTPAHLTVIDAPIILAGPASRTNVATTTATFTVVTAGSPASYQWFLFGTNALTDGGKIFGATSNVLSITNVLGADRGEYSVIVSNAAGVAISTNATLTVVDPAILAQPASTTNTTGSTVTFSVTAVGTSPLSYQWYLDGYELFDETNSTLVLQNIADSDAGEYTVEVANSEGSVLSEPAQLITFPPLIVTQPAVQRAVVGGSASFSVDVNGQVPFTYQWQKDGVNIPGATARIYSLSSVALADAGRYRVVVTNPLGSETSQEAPLFVYDQPYLSMVGYSAGAATLSVLWVPGEACVIEATTDFVTWTPVVTNTAPFNYTDTTASDKRFYRAHTLR